MDKVIVAVGVPLILLNMLGGIVSGVWLAFEGEWDLVFGGLLVAAFGAFACGIALAPSLLIAAPGAVLLQRGNVVLGLPLAFLGNLYTTGVMIAWSLLTHSWIMKNAGYGVDFPAAIWAYGVAIGPWAFMAQKDAQSDPNTSAGMSVFFLQIANIVTGIMYLSGEDDYATLAKVALAIMVVPTILMAMMAREMSAR